MKIIEIPGGLLTYVDDDVYEWAAQLDLKVFVNRSGKPVVGYFDFHFDT